MSTGSINNLSSYLQSVINTTLQGTGSTNKMTPNNLNAIDPSSISLQPDNSQLSPFAQMLTTLQQLQQSDPAKYQQVTQQIATNLQTSAQTAQSDGNTNRANHLNQLATDFTTASKSGQLPNVQDLAQAMGGHHHHHPHVHAGSADANSNSSDGSSSSSTSQLQAQILAAFQTSTSGTQGLAQSDPMAIIMDTLSSSGISLSNG